MNVLVINCGGATVKFQVASVDPDAAAFEGVKRLANGAVVGVGGDEPLLKVETPESGSRPVEAASHESAVRRILEWCRASGLEIEAVGHRLMFGGERFAGPTILDDSALATLELLSGIAPLEHVHCLASLRAVRSALGPGIPMVALFDTSFHLTMPERASVYALPREFEKRHGIRRYGFHGISYRWLVTRYSQIAGIPEGRATFVAFHLGDGCSAAAIAGGRSIDTSMGLTPVEGLVMGTRAGDLDASVVTSLMRDHGFGLDEVEAILNERSGLKGLSGISQDLRVLLLREKEAPGARLAVDVFCYRARKYLGAYLAALSGADAVVFSGGIGENLPAIRARICEDMEWCGLALDPEANRRAVGVEAEIGARGSRIRAFVIPTDEGAVIARETVLCLRMAATRARRTVAARV